MSVTEGVQRGWWGLDTVVMQMKTWLPQVDVTW